MLSGYIRQFDTLPPPYILLVQQTLPGYDRPTRLPSMLRSSHEATLSAKTHHHLGLGVYQGWDNYQHHRCWLDQLAVFSTCKTAKEYGWNTGEISYTVLAHRTKPSLQPVRSSERNNLWVTNVFKEWLSKLNSTAEEKFPDILLSFCTGSLQMKWVLLPSKHPSKHFGSNLSSDERKPRSREHNPDR